MYASTIAHNPPRCVCGVGVRACMCVWVLARKPVNMCVFHVSVSVHAGDSLSAGCLYFSVFHFHFVLYD